MTNYMDTNSRDQIVKMLQCDTLRHIVTLKMINLYGNHMAFDVTQMVSSSTILSKLPTHISEYDKKTYPGTDFVVLIDGTVVSEKKKLIDQLPPATYVVKTYDPELGEYLKSEYGARRTNSFISYTTTEIPILDINAQRVENSSELSDETLSFFQHNGYEETELRRFFNNGARWFGIHHNQSLVSGCFVFNNFGKVWELGGAFTIQKHRRCGFAKANVATALAYLLTNNFAPRYLVKSDNLESNQLARSFGLKPFLTIDHFLMHKQ